MVSFFQYGEVIVKRKLLVNILLIFLVLLLSNTAVRSQSDNLALGADPTESDTGWGGGVYPWDMVDGLNLYPDWQHGLAFTGGKIPYIEPCGWRQATLNFKKMVTFNRVMIWHHGTDHIPTAFNLSYWNGSSWVNTGGTMTIRTDLTTPAPGAAGAGSTPTEHLFPAVTGSKVRFEMNNCDINHGWIYEFEVFNDNHAPVCTTAFPSVKSLWPPFHWMVPVKVLGVTDMDRDRLIMTITGIFQDEPTKKLWHGDMAPDGRIIGNAWVALRAERNGKGDGRVYHINFKAEDNRGGVCTGSVLVSVNHDQSKKGQAVDNGPRYDSRAR